MKIEQLQQRILDKKSQIKNLELDIEKLKDEMIALSEFKIGEKVRVINNDRDRGEVYIDTISVNNYDNKIEYTFAKPKKDGSYGKQGAGIYGNWNLKITKV